MVGKSFGFPAARRGIDGSLAADHEGAGGGVLLGFKARAGQHPLECFAGREFAAHCGGDAAADAIDQIDDRRAGGGRELLERDGGVAAGEVESPLLGRSGHRGRGAGDDGAAQGSDGEGRGDVG